MASSAKHLTRKELREPDRFIVLTHRGLAFVQKHRTTVAAVAVIIVLMIAGLLGWSIYKERQNEQAAQQFDSALELLRSGNHKEALAEFSNIQGYRWSTYAALAYLYEANSHLALENFDAAATAARRFVASTEQHSVYRQLGLVTLGHVEELRDQCKDAIQHYAEAERIPGALRERAVLGKARCHTAVGDHGAAIAAYQQYLKENPNSPIATRLMLQVAELQKTAGGKAPQAAQ